MPLTRYRADRRKLLKAIAGLTVAGRAVGGYRGRDRGRRTIVVGGGLAGLAVLDGLVAAGHTVNLLEASPRMGGRVLTIRQGLAAGLRVEAGAEQIPRSHHRVRALAARFNIDLVDYPSILGAFVFRHGGTFVRFHHPSELPAAVTAGLAPQEKSVWPYQLDLLYAQGADAVVAEDPRSALQWLRDLGLTARGATFVKAFSAVDPERISAAAYQRMSQRRAERGTSQVMENGSDRLTGAIVERHQSVIRANTKIEKIILKNATVVLVDGTGLTHAADHVVLALPLKPLLALDFRPRMPRMIADWRTARRTAIELKVHARIQAAELRALGINQFAMALDFPPMTWALPEISRDGERVLNATATGEAFALVRYLRARGAQALEKLLRTRLPWLQTLRVDSLGCDLNSDPLIGGAYTYAPAGTRFASPPVRDSRLTLAGSDFSRHPGWMEGALESAERAVKEILAADV